MNRIKVSIIITVFNRKEDLKKSIPSLLQGDFPKDEYEILIGDGGSTDSTSEYISDLIEKSKKFPQKFPKIRYFPTLKNLGEMGNSIKPLYASKGKYICYFNSDAIVSKNWLKNIYNLMESKNLDVSGALQLTDPEKDHVLVLIWDLLENLLYHIEKENHYS
ncbi:MAG: glycosyltransferase [Candidatus Hodarchaeota archaeon]